MIDAAVSMHVSQNTNPPIAAATLAPSGLEQETAYGIHEGVGRQGGDYETDDR
jgi:hypothetical protein